MEESYFGINEAANTSPEPLPPKLTKHNRRNYQPLNENTSPTEDETDLVLNEQLKLQQGGLKELWSMIDPVWKKSQEELIEMMAGRVIYESENIIAFDKPYQMAYASGPKDQAQMDRFLQHLKKKLCPDIDRLYLLSPLDKYCTGVILFAKSYSIQKDIVSLINQDKALFRFRCLCKNLPDELKARIDIPLIKVVRGSNFKLCPLIGTANRNEQLLHVKTDYKLINTSAHVSLFDVFIRRALPHVVRSHLFYGANCPLIGDKKYIGTSLKHENVHPTIISPVAMNYLKLRMNDLRKIPMFMHLQEVRIPERTNSNRVSVIKAEIPSFFLHAIKKLRLVHK